MHLCHPPSRRPRATIAKTAAHRDRDPAGDANQMIREDGLAAWPGFLKELRRLGYVEGTNIVLERYSAEGARERFDEFVSDVVGRAPTLIVTAANPFTLLFVNKTKAIPIVAILADPIRYGMVTSLARPGGNLTGVSVDAGTKSGKSAWKSSRPPSLQRPGRPFWAWGSSKARSCNHCTPLASDWGYRRP
jgi:hypothetical protein